MDLIDQAVLEEWQGVVDILAQTLRVPSAVITRFEAPMIEVVRTSQSEGNPYSSGLRVKMLDHYCEGIFKTGRKVQIENAPEDPQWNNAPEIEYGIVSYLGLPIHYPDGDLFGTICVLDRTPNRYDKRSEKLLTHFRNLVEAHIQLAEKNRQLEDKIRQIQTLHGILPICSFCKRIRNDEGYWEQVEKYIKTHHGTDLTHSICPECAKTHYPEFT